MINAPISIINVIITSYSKKGFKEILIVE